jgi:hypothetical protein
MTGIYITAIIVQLGIIIYFVTRGKKQKAATPPVADVDTFEGLRNLALRVTPGDLQLAIPDSQTLVYGVVMDWCMGEAVVTLVSFITGAASLYFSTGGGIIGAGENPAVGELASEFVTFSQSYVGRAMPVSTTELPDKGCIRFYLLTNKRIYAAQEQMIHFEDNSSPWLPLFEKGNEVITEIKVWKQGVIG